VVICAEQVRRLDEISQGPGRDFRLPSGRWLAVLAVIGLIAAVIALSLTGGGHRVASPNGRSTALAAPSPSPSAVPGTVLLTCDSANPGQLGPNWRTTSLRAGPVWFVDGRQLGYVHDDGWQAATRAVPVHGRFQFVVMIVEVATGSTAVIQPAAAARPYFHFVDGYSSGGFDLLPAGDTGFTLAACPRGTPGFNGAVTDFYLGFSIQPGRAAPVDVWSPARPHPIRVIFTCPARGCGTTG
jgi:hypothetical protein